MASAQEPLYKPGQLVWARVKGFPFWPGKVVEDNEMPGGAKPKKKCVCVKFFGPGESSAYCAFTDVQPFFRYRIKYSSAVKKRDFLAAVEDADEYVIANPEVKNFEGDYFGDDKTPEKAETSVEKTLEKISEVPVRASTPNNVRIESVVEKEKPKSPPKRPQADPPTNTHTLKRPAAPINGSDGSTGSSLPKRHMLSPPSIRMKHEFQNKKIGFIGLGTIGSRLVRRLIQQGFRITVYDRSFEKKVETTLKDLSHLPTAPTPAALMQMCDIVFSCVYDTDAAKEVMLGQNGVSENIEAGKAFVELTTIDPVTSIELFEHVTSRGGRFLEAPLSGIKKDAESGGLVFLCAGDKSLFDECGVFFQAIGRRAVFFGDPGNGAKFRLCHQMLAGVIVSAVAEVAAVGYRCGLSTFDLSDVIGDYSPMGCPLVKQAFKDILEGVFEPSQQLGQMQKELQSALHFAGYDLGQPTFVTSAANQMFTFARRQGEEMSDMSAVYRLFSDTRGNESGASTSQLQMEEQG